MNQWKSISHYAALDWASRKHEVVVIDRDGTVSPRSLRSSTLPMAGANCGSGSGSIPIFEVAVESGMGMAVEQLLATNALVSIVPAKNAKAYRERRGKRGKTHACALRCLGNKLIKILWRI